MYGHIVIIICLYVSQQFRHIFNPTVDVMYTGNDHVCVIVATTEQIFPNVQIFTKGW